MPTKTYDLLNRITGGGLSGVYRFTRTVSIFSPKMTSVEITFTNHSDHPIEGIRLGDKVSFCFMVRRSYLLFIRLIDSVHA